MKKIPRTSYIRTSLFILSALAMAVAATQADAAESEWVRPGSDGKLVYKTTPNGDRIMDFSYAGYGGGGVPLPTVPVIKTVRPSGTADDTKAIQAAIDEVAAAPLKDGFRGAVLLEPGTFTCQDTITISASGVVLRGSGSGAGAGPKTTIKLAGRPHLAISLRAAGGRGEQNGSEEAGVGSVRTSIADAYVPSGAISFAVADAKGFAVGDTIAIRKPATEAWIKLMEMHDLVRDGRPQTWMATNRALTTERQIAAISGNTITVDVPLSDSFDAKYLNPPGTSVAKIAPPARISQSGIENLHIESPLQEISHSQPHYTALRINGQDCWVRDLVIDETMNSIGVGGKRITLERVAINRSARHQGASKPAEFAPNGSQVLLDRCTVTGDNVWYVATGGGHAGPIVVLNCTFRGNGRAESHQRWSTGMLYDNCRVPEGGIEIRNRGSMGSGHGWSMGWGVVWNCEAKDYIIQNPPGAMNWLIGSIGHNKPSPRPFGSGPNLPEAITDSPGTPVTPQSLYLAQLAARLGPQALKNIGYSPDMKNLSTAGLSPAAPTAAAKARGVLGEDLAVDRPVSASNVREGKREFAAWQALDGRDETYWATDEGTARATLELDTEGALEINAVEIGEAPGMEQRVQEYKIEGMVDSAWKLLSQGTTIGETKVDRFPKVTVWKVRLTVLKAEPAPAIRKFGLYLDATSPGGGAHPAATSVGS